MFSLVNKYLLIGGLAASLALAAFSGFKGYSIGLAVGERQVLELKLAHEEANAKIAEQVKTWEKAYEDLQQRRNLQVRAAELEEAELKKKVEEYRDELEKERPARCDCRLNSRDVERLR